MRVKHFCAGFVLATVLVLLGGNSIEPRETPLVLAVRKVKLSVAAVTYPASTGVAGAAVAVDRRGYLLTSRHILGTARGLEVRPAGWVGSVPATIVNESRASDLALLKIDPGLVPLALGSGQDLMPGELIFSIGQPLTYPDSLTVGYVSAVDRSLETPEHEMINFFQVTAPINGGNSGGPVCDLRGDLVGVMTSRRQKSQGIAFAVGAGSIRRFLAAALPPETK